MDRSRRERRQLQDRQEATTDRPPEVPYPRRVFQRPPTQCRGSPALDTEQEPPEARNSRSRSFHEQEPPRARTSSRGNAQGRECPATGAFRGETMSAQSEDAKEANMDRSTRERRQLKDRQEATAYRPPEVPDPRRVFQRPPTQCRGSPALDAEQEPPGARTSRRRSLHEQEPP